MRQKERKTIHVWVGLPDDGEREGEELGLGGWSITFFFMEG
jgi:hypothetical protein